MEMNGDRIYTKKEQIFELYRALMYLELKKRPDFINANSIGRSRLGQMAQNAVLRRLEKIVCNRTNKHISKCLDNRLEEIRIYQKFYAIPSNFFIMINKITLHTVVIATWIISTFFKGAKIVMILIFHDITGKILYFSLYYLPVTILFYVSMCIMSLIIRLGCIQWRTWIKNSKRAYKEFKEVKSKFKHEKETMLNLDNIDVEEELSDTTDKADTIEDGEKEEDDKSISSNKAYLALLELNMFDEALLSKVYLANEKDMAKTVEALKVVLQSNRLKKSDKLNIRSNLFKIAFNATLITIQFVFYFFTFFLLGVVLNLLVCKFQLFNDFFDPNITFENKIWNIVWKHLAERLNDILNTT